MLVKDVLRNTRDIAELQEGLGTGGVNTDTRPSETPNGSITTFTTSEAFADGTLMVFVEGLYQEPGVAYTVGDDNQSYNFAIAPAGGLVITHRYNIA